MLHYSIPVWVYSSSTNKTLIIPNTTLHYPNLGIQLEYRYYTTDCSLQYPKSCIQLKYKYYTIVSRFGYIARVQILHYIIQVWVYSIHKLTILQYPSLYIQLWSTSTTIEYPNSAVRPWSTHTT